MFCKVCCTVLLHSFLLEKLKALNFDSNAVSMINSFLRYRIQKVILPSCTCDWIQLYQGVPQGTVLGPLLFNIYVNSFYTCSDHKCSVVQYADDTMVFKFSTTDAPLYATEKIREKVNDKECVCAAFLDLSKAFDSISHDILLEKLKALNFDSNAVSMINSFLRYRIQKVILPSFTSDWIQLYQGVPQGTVLGPLLFNIYVNSLYTCIDHKCSVVQYADDTMVFTSSKKTGSAVESLELNVNNICDFFEKQQLTLNADKTNLSPSKPKTISTKIPT